MFIETKGVLCWKLHAIVKEWFEEILLVSVFAAVTNYAANAGRDSWTTQYRSLASPGASLPAVHISRPDSGAVSGWITGYISINKTSKRQMTGKAGRRDN